MKTEQDYLREAIKFLDYEITEANDDGFFFVFPLETKNGQTYTRHVHCSWQWVKDALAAQLVRQIDQRKVASVYIVPEMTEVQWEYESSDTLDSATSRGPDRNMNTIKAIVDSGVVKDE